MNAKASVSPEKGRWPERAGGVLPIFTKDGVINSIDLGFSFNFATMDDSNKLGIGLGTRCDVLFGVGNKNKSYIGSNVLFGPYFHYNPDSNISLNLTVGPIFNFYFLEDLKNEQITIGPAIDCFATFTPASFQNISFEFNVPLKAPIYFISLFLG